MGTTDWRSIVVSTSLLWTACARSPEPSAGPTPAQEPAWVENPCLPDSAGSGTWTRYDLRAASIRVPREFRRETPMVPDLLSVRERTSRMQVVFYSDPAWTFENRLRQKRRVRVCEGELAGLPARAASYHTGREYVFTAYWAAPVEVNGRRRWIYATVTSPDVEKATILRRALFTIHIPTAPARVR